MQEGNKKSSVKRRDQGIYFLRGHPSLPARSSFCERSKLAPVQAMVQPCSAFGGESLQINPPQTRSSLRGPTRQWAEGTGTWGKGYRWGQRQSCFFHQLCQILPGGQSGDLIYILRTKGQIFNFWLPASNKTKKIQSAPSFLALQGCRSWECHPRGKNSHFYRNLPCKYSG